MAITLKEAEEQHPEVIRRKEYEEKVEYNQDLKLIIKELDKEIVLNINQIKQKPIILLYYSGGYRFLEDIQKQYPDFTIDYGLYSHNFSIKLADKDWDWLGYGIKTPPTNFKQEEPKPKKTIFNLFGLFN